MHERVKAEDATGLVRGVQRRISSLLANHFCERLQLGGVVCKLDVIDGIQLAPLERV